MFVPIDKLSTGYTQEYVYNRHYRAYILKFP
jgi:hypothetical protein